jgi:hypothetical protein
MQEHNHEHGEQEEKESPERLKFLMEHFARLYKFATFRKERCEELMRRKSARKWSPEKTSKMVRRLMAANKEVEQSENALDQLQHRLQQLGIEVEVKSRSAGITTAA